jgi:hypothetical protein
MNLKRSIKIKLDVEGLHNWPGCDIESVQYLKYIHRHTFQIFCTLDVTHGDRDVEFIEFKHKIRKFLEGRYYSAKYDCLNFGPMSCETIAEILLLEFNLTECSVSEDGEFWGTVSKA